MKQQSSDTFSQWRKEGSGLIQQNFEVFQGLVAQVRNLVQRGKYEEAAIYGEIAAWYACAQHCGIFASMELEQILLTIGQKSIQSDRASKNYASFNKQSRNVLHVCTSVGPIGGLSRMLWRWIQQDIASSHSVALTRQGLNEIPEILKEAISDSGGKIYLLDSNPGSLISRAKKLREIATNFDYLILHIHNQDVIPIIAFASKQRSTPVIFLDHADHMFWLGASVSDIVINLRESGMRLAQERRSIDKNRSILLPTIIEPTQRLLSRAEAKQQLGLGENSIVLLSIARAIKYATINGISYVDAHIQFLERYENAFLIIVGSGYREDWADTIQKVHGRIKVFSETKDTAVFYQAADIYVDSFPFVSTTSLLEAGSYGLPLVSRYPYTSDACGIFGAEMPGLAGNLIQVQDIDGYVSTLSRLIDDKEFRLSLGEATQRKILEIHCESSWQAKLEEVYARAANLPRLMTLPITTDQIALGEPDVFLPYIHGWHFNFTLAFQSYLVFLPFSQRLHLWYKLVKENGVGNRITLLLPEWLYSRYQNFKRGSSIVNGNSLKCK